MSKKGVRFMLFFVLDINILQKDLELISFEVEVNFNSFYE